MTRIQTGCLARQAWGFVEIGAARLLRGAATALALLAAGSAANACADVALVLAIDASGSVDDAEYLIQAQGYAAALRSPQVQRALAAAGIVDIGVVFWGDTEWQVQILPITRMNGPADAEALAARITALPRAVSGNTGLGRAISTATDMLEAHDCAVRRIINLSGDGTDTIAPRARRTVPLGAARQRAADAGITINALAIQTDDPTLGRWYMEKVITGPNAFVMQIASYEDFARAIEEKLLREIAVTAVSSIWP